MSACASLFVIDSNVPIVANGRNVNATPQCRSNVLDKLLSILKNDSILVDDAGEMIEEYRRYCDQSGLGDRFFREIIMNYSNKIRRIPLEKDADGNFRDFPTDPELADFDISDRKFACAARKEKVPVLNATDSDWLIHLEALQRNGISVEFLCGCDSATWHNAPD